MPFLNGPTWLTEAIESVLFQTYPNWELVLFDDGSDEEASTVAKNYAKKFPGQICYADHPGHINRGVTASRKSAIALSTGSFIAFLDSDDKWQPRKLEHQLQIFTSFSVAGMICEASIFWQSWKQSNGIDYVVEVGAPANKLYSPGQLLSTIYPLGAGAPPCPSGIILRREVYDRSGGFEEIFSGDYQLYEDQALLTKIYLREYVYISSVPHNYYRKRDGSLTSAAYDPIIYQKVRSFYLQWFDQYIIQNAPTNIELIKLISQNINETNLSPE